MEWEKRRAKKMRGKREWMKQGNERYGKKSKKQQPSLSLSFLLLHQYHKAQTNQDLSAAWPEMAALDC